MYYYFFYEMGGNIQYHDIKQHVSLDVSLSDIEINRTISLTFHIKTSKKVIMTCL